MVSFEMMISEKHSFFLFWLPYKKQWNCLMGNFPIFVHFFCFVLLLIMNDGQVFFSRKNFAKQNLICKLHIWIKQTNDEKNGQRVWHLNRNKFRMIMANGDRSKWKWKTEQTKEFFIQTIKRKSYFSEKKKNVTQFFLLKILIG